MTDDAKKDFGDANKGEKHYILITRNGNAENKLIIKDLKLTIMNNGPTLIENLNLTLQKGDRMILTGPSGSGKSSLARAIRGIWDNGDGEIQLPENAKILCVTQKAYMPNTNLRGVLCYPEKEGFFTDEQMEEALHAVGLSKLVPFMAGRKVQIIIDRLLEKTPADAETLCAAVPALVQEHGFLTEHVNGAQRKQLEDRLGKETAGKLAGAIDEQLAVRMLDHLSAGIKGWVATNLGKAKTYDTRTGKALVGALEKELKRSLGNFFHPARSGISAAKCADNAMGTNLARFFRKYNLETIGLAGLTERQIDFLVDGLVGRIKKEFEPCYADEQNLLRRTFNSLARASLKGPKAFSWKRAKSTAERIVANVALQLHKEKVTGDVLSKTLSGGEQQRVAFARVLLHKPDILILDEITGALDEAAGIALYKDMTEKVPNTIIISIAHNKHIMPFHNLHANLDNREIKTTPIEKPPAPPAA